MWGIEPIEWDPIIPFRHCLILCFYTLFWEKWNVMRTHLLRLMIHYGTFSHSSFFFNIIWLFGSETKDEQMMMMTIVVTKKGTSKTFWHVFEKSEMELVKVKLNYFWVGRTRMIHFFSGLVVVFQKELFLSELGDGEPLLQYDLSKIWNGKNLETNWTFKYLEEFLQKYNKGEILNKLKNKQKI